MQPKNKSERAKAFINFLLLFILSMAIILITVFFSYDVPVKQANELRRQMHNVERDRAFSADFYIKMSEIVGMLDSINTSKDAAYLDTQIKEGIQNLQIKVDADSVQDKILYQVVVKNIFDLQKAKEDLRKLTKTDEDVKEQKQMYDDLSKRYSDLVDKYNQRQLSK